MKHPTKRKQLAKSGEVLGTKNGRNKSIEGHKKIRVELRDSSWKRMTGNVTSVIAFAYWLLLLKLFSDYCY